MIIMAKYTLKKKTSKNYKRTDVHHVLKKKIDLFFEIFHRYIYYLLHE